MNPGSWFLRGIGVESAETIEHSRVTFVAPWVAQHPGWLGWGLFGMAVLSLGFYWSFQTAISRRWRITLASLRGCSLMLLLLVLAEPALQLTLIRNPLPVLWVGLDASDSMQIADELPTPLRQELSKAARLTLPTDGSAAVPTRADYVKSFLSAEQNEWLNTLRQKFQVTLFALSGEHGVERLTNVETSQPPLDDLRQWNPQGRVTALGDALDELRQRRRDGTLAGVILFSDFDQNSGLSPQDVAKHWQVPLYTVGIGPASAIDLAVDLLAPPTMKQAETATVSVTIRQRELDQQSVKLRVWAESTVEGDDTRIPIAEQMILLEKGVVNAEFPVTPQQSGRFTVIAEVDAIPGESVTQNNQSRRDVRIIDDFLRLLYIEYEPTWEWRFVKEVFHRDRLVGTRGFRTFLRSADPIVRETNELFVPNLTLPRQEFFETDVIFLGDLPVNALSTRFCEMTREFVDQFGGGLVVLGGPRFGPGQLAETPLADLLPVTVAPSGRRRETSTFSLQLTPLASQFDFMRLGKSGTSGLDPWANLGQLPWYQPVLGVDPRATVLAQHPTDLCADGKTLQPLIALRPYGRGEVVYLGFNELWRLRRLHGEEYYRQFWGQLIHRLGLSHALGDQKRFVVRTDRRQYRSGDQALITVEAYNEEFQPLSDVHLPGRQIAGEWLRPAPDEAGRRHLPLVFQALRPGIFETRTIVTGDGEHRFSVIDPLTQTPVEVAVHVSDLSIERRNPVRNRALQDSLATATGGKSYDLTTARQLPDDLQPVQTPERSTEVIPLWNTWLTFFLLSTLLLGEWALRKGVSLT